MGKRGGHRGRGRGGGGGRGGGSRTQRSVRVDHVDVPRTNALYEKYYNGLGIVDADEREEFWAALRRDLPNSFRFTGSKGHALQVQQTLKDRYIPEITAIKHEGELVPPPTALPWYPDQLAWQMTTPKNVVRKFGPFKSFQQFLVSETSVGNISRQEVVSMIPPLLLDVRPGMTVLDLCAAPGSKSAQLIEMVHSGEEARTRKVLRKMRLDEGRGVSPDGEEIKQEMEDETLMGDWGDDGRSTGLLVANDVDYKRAHLLIHQMKRLNSPNLIVTNHDATMFPSIKLPSDPTANDGRQHNKYLKFDRILADVPCSGDGTCRKNQNVWKDWNPGNGLGLHPTQVKILVRALQMLKVGGRIVYSTCSMNPVENEAVVASAIDRCGGSDKVSILDCSHALPELRRKPGLKRWTVMDKQGGEWRNWQELEDHRDKHGAEGLGKIAAGMFPPQVSSQELPLERCVRVYGHQQDTGAFFIAVLEKKSEIKARPEAQPKERPPTDVVASTSARDGTTDERPRPSIVAVVTEIESTRTNGGDALEHVNAADIFAPPEMPLAGVNDPSPAVRQNQENQPNQGATFRKRELEDAADAEMATKRPRLREESDAIVPAGEEEREAHRPRPPSAEPDGSRLKLSSLPAPSSSANGPVKRKNVQAFEEPFKYLDAKHEELTTIYDFFRLHPRFPRDRFMVRNAAGNPAKTIYYTSGLARDILIENEGKGLKFVHCGVKMFVKQDVQRANVCRWRIQTDGLSLLEAWVGEERVVRLHSKKTLRKLLIEMFPKVDSDGWKQLGEIGDRVRDIDLGCCVLRVEKGEGEDSFSERSVLPLWRSLHSLNLMLPKEDRKAMLLRLYNETSPLYDHSQNRPATTSTTTDKLLEASSAHVAQAAETEEVGEEIAGIAGKEDDGGDDDDDDDDGEGEGGVRLDPPGE